MIELCEATEDNPFIHGMSKQFVKALQQLFDVMDTENAGLIKFTDLALQWEEGHNDFPKGLVTCLAKVTLPSGLLTFDRFCAGIKLCLLKNQVELKDANGEDDIGGESNQDNSRFADRPSSEPQIFAPPPPPLPPIAQPTPVNTSATPHMPSNMNEINNNTSTLLNKNASFYSSSSFNVSLTNTANLSDDAKGIAKKLPLPSYEQVMAAKTKSMSKLTLQENVATNNSQSFGSDNVPKFTNLNGTSKNSSILCGQLPDEQRRNLYENFAMLSNENTRYPSESFTHRAKSMSHLENLSSNQSAQHFEHDKIDDSKTAAVISELVLTNRSNSVDPKSVSSTSLSRHQPPSQNMQQPKTLSRNCILKTLQSWRDNIMNNKQVLDTPEIILTKDANLTEFDNKSITRDMSSSKPLGSPTDPTANGLNGVNSLKRSVPKRREPRRHTVGANGIDIYAVKRFQQLEQEKDILIRGLNEIDKTKDWYMRQIANIQDKINLAGRSGTFPSDCNIDAYQERINFQATRIQNLNQHLVALREANHSFPLHMNLAIRPFNGVQRIDPNQPKQLVLNPNLVNKLKEQHKLLTDEVSRKNDRITQLEREKSSLIRELFQARTYSSYYNGDFDDTFM